MLRVQGLGFWVNYMIGAGGCQSPIVFKWTTSVVLLFLNFGFLGNCCKLLKPDPTKQNTTAHMSHIVCFWAEFSCAAKFLGWGLRPNYGG